jgi:ABC-2 type transport system permease protein
MTAAIAQTGHVAARRLRNVSRQPWYLVVVLLEPFFWLVFFGGVFRQVIKLPAFSGTHSSYLDYLLPGMVIMTALINGAWAGENMLADMDRGILDRLLAAPAKRSALIIGPLAQQTVVVLVQGVIMLILGVILGGHLHGGVVGACILFASAILLALGAGALSNALALIVRRQESLVAALNFVTLPATFLSTAFMPANAVAPWIATAAGLNPVNWAVTTGRAATATPVNWTEVASGAGKLTAFAAVSIIAAIWSFRRYMRST